MTMAQAVSRERISLNHLLSVNRTHTHTHLGAIWAEWPRGPRALLCSAIHYKLSAIVDFFFVFFVYITHTHIHIQTSKRAKV